jgi:hypothetical protein
VIYKIRRENNILHKVGYYIQGYMASELRVTRPFEARLLLQICVSSLALIFFLENSEDVSQYMTYHCLSTCDLSLAGIVTFTVVINNCVTNQSYIFPILLMLTNFKLALY